MNQATMKFTAKRFGPLARNSDEDTSKDQAVALLDSGKADKQCDWVAYWVLRHPGHTFMELAAIAAASDSSAKYERYCDIFHKRLSLAKDRGLIKKGPKRRCGVNEIRKLTWWPV